MVVWNFVKYGKTWIRETKDSTILDVINHALVKETSDAFSSAAGRYATAITCKVKDRRDSSANIQLVRDEEDSEGCYYLKGNKKLYFDSSIKDTFGEYPENLTFSITHISKLKTVDNNDETVLSD